MIPELDEEYFIWLVSQVSSVKSKVRSKTYWSLLGLLHEREFAWFVPNDDNRVEDARQLQCEFLEAMGIDYEPRHGICSFLEMMVALSRRLSFEVERQPRWWFWHLMHNLGLSEYTDARPFARSEVTEVLDAVIWRTYSPNGVGGLFPLDRPREDQTKVEIWYQMQAYLIERY